MTKRSGPYRAWTATIALLIAAHVAAGCSDDDPVGPQFGDLEFFPAFIYLEMQRDATTELSNVGDVALGPITIDAAPGIGIGAIAGEVCADMDAVVTPGSINSLAPGGAVDLDIVVDVVNVEAGECNSGVYDIDVTAAVGGLGLAATTVRIDWVDPAP